MITKKQILEDIEDELFDTGISASELKNRKISLARVLDQANRARTKAEKSGQITLVNQLQDRIDLLQELLNNADETTINSSSKEKSGSGDESHTDSESDDDTASEKPGEGSSDAEEDETKKDGDDNDTEEDKETKADETDETDETEKDFDDKGSSEKTPPASSKEGEEPDSHEADHDMSGGRPNKDNGDRGRGSSSSSDNDGEENDEGDGNSERSGDEEDTSSDGDNDDNTETKSDKSDIGTSSKDKSKDSTESSDGDDGDDGLDDDGDGSDSDDDTESDDEDTEDPKEPKIKDNKILLDPFNNRPGADNKLPKELSDKLKSGELDLESVFDAAKRILSKLSGEAKKGALQGIKDLLAKNGITVEESFKPSLQEALTKTLAQMSDDEFNNELATTMELVDKVLEVDYSDDLESRALEIKRDAASRLARVELDKEDEEHVKADHSAIKAFNKENDKYKKVKGLRGLESFEASLYRAISDQVEQAEDEVDSWAALDRRHEDDPSIIVKGRIMDDVDAEVPTINVYFDQSGSWREHHIEIGKRAISVINKFQEEGRIKLNIFYMSAGGIFSTSEAARVHPSAEGWHAALEHIKGSKVKNVVILSDSDLDYFEWSNRPSGNNGRTVVDGCVWWLWKDNEPSKKATKELVGRKGNYEYQFSA